MTKHNIMGTRENWTDPEQVDMWWDYNFANPDDPVSFPTFNEMMQGFTFE